MTASAVTRTTDLVAESAPEWLVVHTHPRHEKQVATRLGGQGIEHFLPLYQTRRKWADREVDVDLPLFSGYVFVRVPYESRLRVLKTPSIVGFVSFGGKPAAVQDEEIACLRRGLAQGGKAEPFPFLKLGQTVRVRSGPFAGMTGTLKRKQGRARLVVSLMEIGKSVLLDIDGADIERC